MSHHPVVAEGASGLQPKRLIQFGLARPTAMVVFLGCRHSRKALIVLGQIRGLQVLVGGLVALDFLAP
jgi:hypothetical protein